jgi:FlaA1/EpsC-like NDP-sugar epimerase
MDIPPQYIQRARYRYPPSLLLTIAKNFTLVKIDLKTRELLKSTEQQLKILSLLQVMIQEENSIIGILQDGQTIIYQMRDDTSYLPIGFCSSDKQSKHISHYVK